jgi:hypothetical protein
LDWIVMKCLEKDRTRRYESASGLARDIQRHLTDEPVEACPPSAVYRMSKVVRKYRAPLQVAGAFLLLLVLGVIVSTVQAFRATVAERAARLSEQVAQDRQREADEARNLALKRGTSWQPSIKTSAAPITWPTSTWPGSPGTRAT